MRSNESYSSLLSKFYSMRINCMALHPFDFLRKWPKNLDLRTPQIPLK